MHNCGISVDKNYTEHFSLSVNGKCDTICLNYNENCMDIETLIQTSKQLMKKGKGILAADESEATAGNRLKSIGVQNTEENRRLYRDLFLSTPGIGKYLNGVILHDETLRQKNNEGLSFVDVLTKQDILPGIKVDKGVVDFEGFPGEKITEGLDGLRERLNEYYSLGARFAKWRSVIAIGENIPTL